MENFHNDRIKFSGGISSNELTFSEDNIFIGDEVLATLTRIDTNTLTEPDFI